VECIARFSFQIGCTGSRRQYLCSDLIVSGWASSIFAYAHLACDKHFSRKKSIMMIVRNAFIQETIQEFLNSNITMDQHHCANTKLTAP